MIAKLICLGRGPPLPRCAACAQRWLSCQVAGLTTNLPLLSAVTAHRSVR